MGTDNGEEDGLDGEGDGDGKAARAHRHTMESLQRHGVLKAMDSLQHHGVPAVAIC
jgi:hypothetical protein